MFKKIFKMFKGKAPDEREKAKKSAEDLRFKKEVKKQEKKQEPPFAKASEDKKPAVASVGTSDSAHRIFLRPLVSEKTAHLGSYDVYAFVVSQNTNKVEIKRSFVQMYKVKPISVKIINMPKRQKRFGRTMGMQSAWKKAYVRVPKGSNISIYEGV